ncbi:MAG TPA: DolP-mannose mannosyltransferase [Blastocatellia bacterium]|nr:DolP-mannose mannosyltransferase [Blastocatellia bacterium]
MKSSPPVVAFEKSAARLLFVRLADARTVALMAFFVGAAVVLAHRPFIHIEMGDEAIYDYISQSIVRGQVPYRDVIDPKAPASMYISAAAMAAGRVLGLSDIIAVRWLHIFEMGLLAAITFLVAEAYFCNRLASLLAFFIPLLFDIFSYLVTRGTQPKLPMIIFGMLTLLLIAKDKPLWAGVCSMLSCLCWQPGLMFTGVALMIFSKYFTSWRDLRAAKVAIGAAAPLALVLLYFYLKGALGDLWTWTVIFPYGAFGPQKTTSLSDSFNNISKVMGSRLNSDLILVKLAAAGLLIYIAARAWRIIRREEKFLSADLFKDAIIYPPIIYLLFSIISFQSGGDLIPFFPFTGLFAAWFIVQAARLAARAWSKLEPLIPITVMIIISTLIIVRAATNKPPKQTLQQQRQEAQVLASYLGPDDKIYVHGVGEILVLLNRPNLNKYIALDSGADDFIAAQKPGGFQDVINEMEAQAPKIVVAARLRNVSHRKEIKEWLSNHYERLAQIQLKGVFIRKQ